MGERVGNGERSSLEEKTVVRLAAAGRASSRCFCDEAGVGCGEADTSREQLASSPLDEMRILPDGDQQCCFESSFGRISRGAKILAPVRKKSQKEDEDQRSPPTTISKPSHKDPALRAVRLS